MSNDIALPILNSYAVEKIYTYKDNSFKLVNSAKGLNSSQSHKEDVLKYD